MGEVYRARNTRLDRTVAIKVLPSRRSASPDVRQRFDEDTPLPMTLALNWTTGLRGK